MICPHCGKEIVNVVQIDPNSYRVTNVAGAAPQPTAWYVPNVTASNVPVPVRYPDLASGAAGK